MNATSEPQRFDAYRTVHKAIRAMMTHTLMAVGKMDPRDACEVADTMAAVRLLLNVCAAHIRHENQFIHPRMEAGAPGSSQEMIDEHAHHEQAIASLEADIKALEQAQGPARIGPAHRLYRDLAVFVADNFLHMHVEETENNAILWKHYTDQELLMMQQEIVGSLSNEERAINAKWMFPNLTAVERAQMLLGLRAGLPAPAFAGLLGAVHAHLDDLQWRKLTEALAAAQPASSPGVAA